LRVELFHVNRWWRIRFTIAENPGSPFEELISQGRDDICVDIELRGQLGQRRLALNGGKRHLCLEGRAVVLAGSSRHGISCSRHHAAVRQEIHLSRLSRLPEPALFDPAPTWMTLRRAAASMVSDPPLVKLSQ
ncbi:MAG: hypothetical protein ING06_16340, partial [Roseomonas sp.]|nr:hypothetical protein [Roseomonas sp.]